MRLRTVVTAIVCLLAASACRGGGSEVPAIPPEVALATSEWPMANQDYGNHRAAQGSSITSDNVSELEVAWTFELDAESSYGAAATNPLVIEGVVYFQDLENNVHALDFETGEVIWQQRLGIPNQGPNGVAVGYGKLFAVWETRGVVALDLKTGDELWTRDITAREGEGIDIQPTVHDGRVLVSTVPGDSAENLYQPGTTGVLYALDQADGNVLWSFDTVDSDDIWGNPAINSGGGAWFPPAIDIATGTTYWGTANPAPWPGTEAFPNGSSRPGDNLYTNSLVALDEQGDLEWHHQVRPHDLFDLDYQLAMLADGLVIGAGKTGTVNAFDPQSGEMLWETVVGVHENDDLSEVPRDTQVQVAPGPFGGIETPMAFADGVVYAAAVNGPAFYTSDELVPGGFDFSAAAGELVAIEAQTDEVLWQVNLPKPPLGGATVVNDLVFTATYDGFVYAFDRQSGDKVWMYQLPAGVNAWPAVVGDTIVWPAGVPTTGGMPSLVALRLPR